MLNIDTIPSSDLSPNQGKLPTDFEQYRRFADSFSGMMRVGPDSPDSYKEICEAQGVSWATLGEGIFAPVVASNSDLHAFSADVVGRDCKIGLVPVDLVPEELKNSGAFFPVQRLFADETVDSIVKGDPSYLARIEAEHIATGQELLGQNGAPEYIVLSGYEIDKDSPVKRLPPDDIDAAGRNITVNREKMVEKFEEIVRLHQSVFDSQTVQTGYYGGLDREKLDELIADPSFVPIMATNQETGDIEMFAIFAPNFTDFDSLTWVNQSRVEELSKTIVGNGDDVLVLPLVITSKVKGISLMKYAIQLAYRATIYGTTANSFSLLYECNGLSIGFTPKMMHRTLTQEGFRHTKSIVESTTYQRSVSVDDNVE